MSKINPRPMPSKQECELMEKMAQRMMVLMSELLKDESPKDAHQRSRTAMCFHLSISLMIALADLKSTCIDSMIVTNPEGRQN